MFSVHQPVQSANCSASHPVLCFFGHVRSQHVVSHRSNTRHFCVLPVRYKGLSFNNNNKITQNHFISVSEGDPCTLPLSRGSGNQFMDRFYYNQQTGSCQQFTYSGLHGNQNNFMTQQACEEQCGPNPCFEGRPFVGADGRTQTCSASANFNTCPLNHWCHIGSDLSTTVCCPGASTNVCNLPMSTGEGNANLDRFYYDAQSKTCRPFVYNGLKGNQNNFISLRACQLSCQPLDNPCIGQPATTAAGQVLFCSITNKDSCPVNFWCHIGATPETTVCCPGATNPCSVPLAPGTGNAGLARYYYNPDDRQCLPFQYNGKRGNQNNFESQTECERTCPEDPCDAFVRNGEGSLNLTRFYYNPVEGDCFPFQYKGSKGNENNFLTLKMCQETFTTACFGGETPLMNNGRVIQCHNVPCPASHYCHRGADVRSTVCCARRGNSCDQQLMLGVGDVTIERFYYDTTDDACLSFNYTGVGGNENNFLTKAECQIACPGYRGYCPHGKPDVADHRLTTCGIDTGCPRDHVCHVSKRGSKTVCCPDPATFCLVRADPGPCNRQIAKWAYDKTTGTCKKFMFSGCQGNLNSFDTVEKCTEICCDKGY
uniref:BPTI/Kunitz inhibitor domain-containing protein n=1 Tax=Caenorhabditis japonica TaxID=281687 RepID=A0A8R1DPX5_CAEJA